MALNFRNGGSGMDDMTSFEYETITPSDGTDLAYTTVEVHLGTGGDVSVIDTNGNTKTLVSLSSGYHRLAANRIRSTGTTAANITVFY